ncbi:hypothetical protein [Paenibacillus donghaensis]|nr:hypothetical protein [Paenibacillus donghaensis]
MHRRLSTLFAVRRLLRAGFVQLVACRRGIPAKVQVFRLKYSI